MNEDPTTAQRKPFPIVAGLVGAPRLRELLAAGANVHEIDHQGRTALFRTCRLGQTEKVLLLLAAGANPNATDAQGESPLQVAARYGHLACLEALIKAGAHINYCQPGGVTEFCETALCSAVRKSPDAARLLLAHGADPNVASETRRLPLLMAALYNRSELIPLLIAHGARVDACDSQGSSALHLAARSHNGPSVRALLDAGADPSATNSGGETPVFVAVTSDSSRLAALRELLTASPDLSTLGGHSQQTALEWALWIGASEAVELLRSAGSPPPRERRADTGEITIAVALSDEDLAAAEAESETDGTNWRAAITALDEEALVPTAQDCAWALQADRELPSIMDGAGPEFSRQHWELFRNAETPSPLTRMAYFARGYQNAPKGCELQDGPAVLGESYTSAVERLVTQGVLARVSGPRAIEVAYTRDELCALARQHQAKPTGTKGELAKRLFAALGEAAFAERLQAVGGIFELTPLGVEKAGSFTPNHGALESQHRSQVIDALVAEDFLSAARGVRLLALLNRTSPREEVKTNPEHLALARALRGCRMPSSLTFAQAMESRYLSIVAASALFRPGSDWGYWDSTLQPPTTQEGELVRPYVLSAAFRGCYA